jgi:hypothetical protein
MTESQSELQKLQSLETKTPPTPAALTTSSSDSNVVLNRQTLTREAGVEGLAAVVQADLQPRSELEAMLGDQLAAGHNTALRLLQAASTRRDSETAIKLTMTSCRVMTTFQQGLLVMHRLRHGEQRVVVQHVQLSDNAQAIVAGELKKHVVE